MDVGYLSLPLLIRVTTPRAWLGIAPYASAGITYQREVSCSAVATPPHVGFPGPPPQPVDCDGWRLERDLVGLTNGFGVKVGRGTVSYLAEVRTTHGLRDLYPSPYSESRTLSRSRNVQIGVTWQVRRRTSR